MSAPPLLLASPAAAHNGAVHRAMTETAYNVILGAERFHDKATMPAAQR